MLKWILKALMQLKKMFGTNEFVALNKTMQRNADHRAPLKKMIFLV